MSRVALVTGSSRGIGRAIAVSLAQSGARVAVNFNQDAEAAKHTLSLIEAAGSEGVCVQADVGNSSDVKRCFDEVEDAIGPVEVLVNNAGSRSDGLVLRMSDEAWDEVIRVNLFGTFACTRRALRPMIAGRWGRIVNVASVAGLRGSPGQANYAAAKGGVVALTKTIAREIAGRGVTVNAVAPGLIDTDLTAELTETQRKALLSQVPQGKTGTPEDVAELVSWLCTEEASFVTGSVFVTDGGMTA